MRFLKQKVSCALLCAGMLLLLGFAPAMAAQGQGPGGIPVLDPEGMLNLVTNEGEGKIVIISVFASWCPPCREEMPLLVKLRNDFTPDKVLMVGLSADEDMQDLQRFVDEHKLNFPVYSGSMELLQLMRIGSIPHTFIFNKKGELSESIVGLVPELQFRLIIAKLSGE